MVFAEMTGETFLTIAGVTFLVLIAGLVKIAKGMWASDAGKGILAALFKKFLP